MTEAERYLFDLNGYLVVRGVLSKEEIEAANRVIDEVLPSWDAETPTGYVITGWDEDCILEDDADPAQGPVGVHGQPLLDWGEPIRKLVGHEKILPYLIELMGPTLRLDHHYAILMNSKGSALPLHGGATPYDPSQYFCFRDDRFYCGVTVASFALTDAPPGAGGFCCVPGSHKSNLPLPLELKDLTNPGGHVVQVALERGDVVLFPETLTHGTLEWKARHERRALLFKYCPGHIQWSKGPSARAMSYDWADHQKSLVRPASWMMEEMTRP